MSIAKLQKIINNLVIIRLKYLTLFLRVNRAMIEDYFSDGNNYFSS